MPATRPDLHPRRLALPLLAAAALWLAGTGTALANKPTDWTAGELALLPKYCPDTQGFSYGDAVTNTSPRAAYWVARLGPGFWAVHHHCWGLLKVRRAMLPGTPPEIRRGLLEQSIGEYDYVIRNTPPTFALLPDVYMKMGDSFVLMGEIARANEAYAKARSLKPDFWPVYVQWATTLDRSGNRKNALVHLEEGMRHNPGAQELHKLYKSMGGNADAFVASLPKPVAQAASAPPADSSAAAAGQGAEAAAAQPARPGASAP